MPKRYSENMAWVMDQEIRSFLVEAENKAEEIVKNNRPALENLSSALIKEEVLDKNAIERIIKESKAA